MSMNLNNDRTHTGLACHCRKHHAWLRAGLVAAALLLLSWNPAAARALWPLGDETFTAVYGKTAGEYGLCGLYEQGSRSNLIVSLLPRYRGTAKPSPGDSDGSRLGRTEIYYHSIVQPLEKSSNIAARLVHYSPAGSVYVSEWQFRVDRQPGREQTNGMVGTNAALSGSEEALPERGEESDAVAERPGRGSEQESGETNAGFDNGPPDPDAAPGATGEEDTRAPLPVLKRQAVMDLRLAEHTRIVHIDPAKGEALLRGPDDTFFGIASFAGDERIRDRKLFRLDDDARVLRMEFTLSVRSNARIRVPVVIVFAESDTKVRRRLAVLRRVSARRDLLAHAKRRWQKWLSPGLESLGLSVPEEPVAWHKAGAAPASLAATSLAALRASMLDFRMYPELSGSAREQDSPGAASRAPAEAAAPSRLSGGNTLLDAANIFLAYNYPERSRLLLRRMTRDLRSSPLSNQAAHIPDSYVSLVLKNFLRTQKFAGSLKLCRSRLDYYASALQPLLGEAGSTGPSDQSNAPATNRSERNEAEEERAYTEREDRRPRETPSARVLSLRELLVLGQAFTDGALLMHLAHQRERARVYWSISRKLLKRLEAMPLEPTFSSDYTSTGTSTGETGEGAFSRIPAGRTEAAEGRENLLPPDTLSWLFGAKGGSSDRLLELLVRKRVLLLPDREIEALLPELRRELFAKMVRESSPPAGMALLGNQIALQQKESPAGFSYLRILKLLREARAAALFSAMRNRPAENKAVMAGADTDASWRLPDLYQQTEELLGMLPVIRPGIKKLFPYRNSRDILKKLTEQKQKPEEAEAEAGREKLYVSLLGSLERLLRRIRYDQAAALVQWHSRVRLRRMLSLLKHHFFARHHCLPIVTWDITRGRDTGDSADNSGGAKQPELIRLRVRFQEEVPDKFYENVQLKLKTTPGAAVEKQKIPGGIVFELRLSSRRAYTLQLAVRSRFRGIAFEAVYKQYLAPDPGTANTGPHRESADEGDDPVLPDRDRGGDDPGLGFD